MAIDTEHSPQLELITFDDAETDRGIVFHDSLKSSTRPSGAVLTNGATASYTDDGMSNGGDGWIQYTPSAPQIAALQNNAHIHFECESKIVAMGGTGTINRIITLVSGGEKFLSDAGGNLPNNLANAQVQVLGFFNTDITLRSHVTFDFIITNGGSKMYINGLLCLDVDRVPVANNFGTINLFSSQTGSDLMIADVRFRNFFVRTGVFSRSHHPQLSNILQFGDSLFQQGNLALNMPNQNGNVGASHRDLCATGELYRKLLAKGLATYVTNKAVTGHAVIDFTAVVSATSSYEITGKIVIVNIGINDAKTGTLTANFAADYLAVIDAILVFKPAHIFVNTITPTAESTARPWATAKPAVLQANIAIKAAADSSADVSLVDLYTYAGGKDGDATVNDYIVSDYKTEDLHWSAIGSVKFGNYMINQIMNHYGK